MRALRLSDFAQEGRRHIEPFREHLKRQHHAALDRLLNNHELYISLLRRFVGDYSSVASDLAGDLSYGRKEEAQENLHRFKSIAGAIGADKLQIFSTELESCLRDELDYDVALVRFNDEFDRLFRAVREGLQSAAHP